MISEQINLSIRLLMVIDKGERRFGLTFQRDERSDRRGAKVGYFHFQKFLLLAIVPNRKNINCNSND